MLLPILRNIIIIFNFVLACIGLYLVWMHELNHSVPLKLKFFDEFINEISYMTNLLIPMGIMTITIAVSVFLRTASKKRHIHRGYIITLTLFVVAETTAGVYMYMGSKQIRNKVDRSMMNWMQRYPDDPSSAAILNFIHADFGCCGIQNWSDWSDIGKNIPLSCCGKPINASESADIHLCPESIAFKEGCSNLVVDLMEKVGQNYLRTVISIICIMVVMLMSTFAIRYVNIRDKQCQD